MRNIPYYILAVILISIYILGAALGGYKLFLFMLLLMILVLALANIIAIRKPTNQEWKDLDELWHFTSKKNIRHIKINNGEVKLKASRNPLVNAFVYGRPAVYFFYKQPSKLNKGLNLPATDTSVKITIDAKNLERKYVRLRKYDSTLLFLKDYKGPGKIT